MPMACTPETSTEMVVLKDFSAGRMRTRSKKVMYDKNGLSVARIEISIVNRAPPLPYEYAHVWLKKCPPYIDGVFVRKLSVREKFQRKGYGTTLLGDAKALAHALGKRTYFDMKANDTLTRTFVQKEGGWESIFWHTPRGTLMVRYIWQ